MAGSEEPTMDVFLVSCNMPKPDHGAGSETLVQYHLADQLIQRGHGVTLQVVAVDEDDRELPAEEQAARKHLQAMGVEALPRIVRSDYATPKDGSRSLPKRAWRRFLDPQDYHYPATRLAHEIQDRVRESPADRVLVFWDGPALAATHGVDEPKMAYYGDPDHLVRRAVMQDPVLADRRSLVREGLNRQRLWSLRRQHLRLVRDCDIVSTLSAQHADLYARAGHPDARYIQNMWPRPPEEGSAEAGDGGDDVITVVGSIGRMDTTGNTIGLGFIARELVPRLDERLDPGDYRIEALGPGSPDSNIEDAIPDHGLELTGWVDDLEAAIRRADLFLVANNTGTLTTSYTRHLVAWSLGACVVGYRDDALANPEMEHRENILLADDADHMADLVVEAGRDPDLRRRIGRRGFDTYERHFTPEQVGRKIETALQDLR